MMRLRMALIWGTKLWEIRNLLNVASELYLGILINELRYKNEADGIIKKKGFAEKIGAHIKKINDEVTSFNKLGRNSFPNEYEALPKINLSAVKEIILKHKGDYPETNSTDDFADEVLGNTDSPSSLARKHTALLIGNSLQPLRIALKDFVDETGRKEAPFDEYIKGDEKFRAHIGNEIRKSLVSYSVGLKGEAVFIIGRTLENLCFEYLELLKKSDQRLYEIDIKKLTFDSKLNILHSKLNKITPGQHSKGMALKWDRNSFGHYIRGIKSLEKEADSSIKSGINLLLSIDKKIVFLKKRRGADRKTHSTIPA